MNDIRAGKSISPAPKPSTSSSSRPSSFSSAASNSNQSESTRRRPAARPTPPPRSSSRSSSSSSSSAQRPRPSSDRKTSQSSASASAASPGAGFRPEQQALAKNILKLKHDYYKVLGLKRGATDAEINRAYKKMALKLHPDKNKAPEAEDAFKLVSQAKTCLGDPQDRAYYDQTGEDSSTSASGQRGGGGGGRRRGRGGQQHPFQGMTPEEIFQYHFFGGRPHARGRQQQRGGGRGQQQQRAQEPQGLRAFLLPLLFIFLFTFMSTPQEPTLNFGLKPTGTFSVKRQSRNRQAPYYVSPQMNRRYNRDYRSLAQVEVLVEEEYMKHLTRSCKEERIHRDQVIQEARRSPGIKQAEFLHRAESMPLPSCDSLYEYQVNW